MTSSKTISSLVQNQALDYKTDPGSTSAKKDNQVYLDDTQQNYNIFNEGRILSGVKAMLTKQIFKQKLVRFKTWA